MHAKTIWLIVGFIGQGAFFMRFLIQWMASEKKKESIIPVQFWYLSIIGSVMVFAYAVWRKDPVIITGQLIGILVYVRNLILVYRKEPAEEV